MSILIHGSDLSLSLTTTPLVDRLGGTLNQALLWMTKRGFHAAQLDLTRAGTRPRDLDRRARKDLLALFGRRGIRLAGVDLFIPRDHFLDPAHQDRAVHGALAGIELAADLGRIPIALALPVAHLPEAVASELITAADIHGVPVAVHAEDHLDALLPWLEKVDHPLIGAGLDPAAPLAHNDDPISWLQRLSGRLLLARLSDALPPKASEDGLSHRVPVSQGRLDLSGYRISADLASRRNGPMILDLRHLAAPLSAAETAKTAWERESFNLGTS